MLRLEIPREILEEMLERAGSAAPAETCGILAGAEDRVERLYKMTNVAERCDRYMMKPQEQFAVVKDIRAAGLKMLAIYHSHPAMPAWPSAEDIRLALTKDMAYVIVSLEDPDRPVVRGFNIDDRAITEVAIEFGE